MIPPSCRKITPSLPTAETQDLSLSEAVTAIAAASALLTAISHLPHCKSHSGYHSPPHFISAAVYSALYIKFILPVYTKRLWCSSSKSESKSWGLLCEAYSAAPSWLRSGRLPNQSKNRKDRGVKTPLLSFYWLIWPPSPSPCMLSLFPLWPGSLPFIWPWVLPSLPWA